MRDSNNKIDINQYIFDLSRKDKTYDEIVEELKNKGLIFTKDQIRKRCKRICKAKGIEPPKEKWGRVSTISDDEIYEKRETMTFEQMVESFKAEGKKITVPTLSIRYKNILKKRGEEKSLRKEYAISSDRMIELRDQGYSYQKIAEMASTPTNSVSYSTIRRILKKMQKQQVEDDDSLTLDELEYLLQEIYKTYTQIKEKRLKSKERE